VDLNKGQLHLRSPRDESCLAAVKFKLVIRPAHGLHLAHYSTHIAVVPC
jgi:hypothetical protein